MKSASAILLLSFTFFIATAQQVTNPVLYSLTEKDGLSDNVANCFFQDSRGVMWIGTYFGLNSYDGSVIKTYHPSNDKSSLPDDAVSDIKEDSNGVIWIATGNGLASYDLKQKKFTTFHCSKNDPVLNRYYSLVIVDRDILLATEHGLIAFNIDLHQFRIYTNAVAAPGGNNRISKLFIDSKKRVWLGTYNGLWLFDNISKSFQSYDNPGNDPSFEGLITDIYEDHSGTIWFGTWSSGLKIIHPENKKVECFNHYKGSNTNITSITSQVNKEGKAELWVCNNLSRLDTTTKSFRNLNINRSSADQPVISSRLYCDKNNLLWISTNEGIKIYNPEKQYFNNYMLSSHGPLTSQGIALLPLQNKFLLGAEAGTALMLFDDSIKLVENLSAKINTSGAVMNIQTDSKSNYWICTSHGLLLFDSSFTQRKLFAHDDQDPASLPKNFLNGLLLKKNGEVWILPWRLGIWQMNIATGKFFRLVNNTNDTILANANLSKAVEDDNGNVWFADYSGGLYKYNCKNGTIRNVFGARRFSNEYLIAGKLWTVSSSEIIAVDINTDEVLVFPLPPGKSKYEFDFIPDNRGNLWIATKTGLLAFNMKTHQFKTFSEEDGLFSNTMDVAFANLSNGNVFFSGATYASTFSPSIVTQNSDPAALLFTGLVVEGKEKHIISDKINLNWDEKNIAFNWALLNFSNPLGNQYYCKLEGVDKTWRFVGNHGQINYNSLEPGTYIFHYKAAVADGVMSGEQSIVVTVHPPFWKRWWFISLLVLLIGLLLYYLIDKRIKNIRSKAVIKQQMSELEMKALRAQMNPHFIFNSLNSIQECIVSNDTDAAYEYLSQFSKLVRRILENSGKALVPLKEELELMQWYLRLEQLRFTDKFTFHIEANCRNPQTEIPSMIIQPFIENALWHGLAHRQGDKSLQLKVEDEDQGIKITISDNGIGRKAAVLLPQRHDKQSIGLIITKERLQNYSKASSVLINDLLSNKGEAMGTEVIIHLPHN